MTMRLAQKIPGPVRAWMRILASYSVSLPLVAASLALLLMLLQNAATSSRTEEVTALLARQQTEKMVSTINDLRERVASVARLDTVNPPVDPQASERTLRQAFRGADSVRLIALGPLGIADKHNEAIDALPSHVQRDMLRRASESNDVVIDAFPGKSGWHVSLAHRLTDFGVLLVTYPASYFRDTLSANLHGEAQAKVVVRYQNQTRVLLETAIDNPGSITTVRPLPVEEWYIHVTPSQDLLDNFSGDNTPLLLVTLVCMLIAVLNVIFSARSSRELSAALARSEPDEDGDADVLSVFSGSPAPAKTAGQGQTAEPSPESAREPETQGGAAGAIPTAEFSSISREDLAAIPGSIFRAYDIRGIAADQLDDDTCYGIGRALAGDIAERGHREILVARDGRHSSERIRDALVRGLRDSGTDVVDLGLVPTPLLHFATFRRDIACGVMVTGSHSPPNYNGMKIVIDRQALSDTDIRRLQQRVEAGEFDDGSGDYRSDDIVTEYIDHICSDVAVARRMKVVIDAGNGATSEIAPRLFKELGCRADPLFCEIDGDFPNHPPDPTVEKHLDALKQAVRAKRADIGIAFDGDGDRVAVVTARGRLLATDQLLMLLAHDVVGRNPGSQVLFDVKSSRHLNRVISDLGGLPVMWKSGHSFMRRKMSETGALVGAELSGHIFFNERWFGFDDGMYAAARLLETLSLGSETLDELLDHLPQSVSTPEILVPADDEYKFEVIRRVAELRNFEGGTINDLDGIRVDFADGWGLVRASNTGPALTLRFEADSHESLDRIRRQFREVLSGIDSELAIGF